MTLAEALEIVLDLASDNAISAKDADNHRQARRIYACQQEALGIVAALYAEEAKQEARGR